MVAHVNPAACTALTLSKNKEPSASTEENWTTELKNTVETKEEEKIATLNKGAQFPASFTDALARPLSLKMRWVQDQLQKEIRDTEDHINQKDGNEE